MTALLVTLSVLVAWALLGVLATGLLLMVKSLQSTRGWLQKTTVGLRAIEHQTRELPTRGAAAAVALREALDALHTAAGGEDDAAAGKG